MPFLAFVLLQKKDSKLSYVVGSFTGLNPFL